MVLYLCMTAVPPQSDILRAIYCGCQELNEDGRFVGVAGDTYIMAVEWDADGHLESRSIHQFGSATLDETSPHYADQADDFVAMELRDFPWMQSEVLDGATRDYVVGGR